MTASLKGVQAHLGVTQDEATSADIAVSQIKRVMRTTDPIFPCPVFYKLMVSIYLEIQSHSL